MAACHSYNGRVTEEWAGEQVGRVSSVDTSKLPRMLILVYERGQGSVVNELSNDARGTNQVESIHTIGHKTEGMIPPITADLRPSRLPSTRLFKAKGDAEPPERFFKTVPYTCATDDRTCLDSVLSTVCNINIMVHLASAAVKRGHRKDAPWPNVLHGSCGCDPVLYAMANSLGPRRHLQSCTYATRCRKSIQINSEYIDRYMCDQVHASLH